MSQSQEKERVYSRAAVAVRGDSGFFFGTLKWIEPGRLLAEIDAELQPGEALDVRVTLTPTSSTALLRGRVNRPLVVAQGELPRFVIDLTGAADEERAKLAEWMRNIRNRGTFSSFETVISGASHGRPMDQHSPDDVRHALERLGRKPLGSSPPTDPFGVRSDIATGPSQGGGRSAIRDALRGAIARNTVPPGGGRAVAGRDLAAGRAAEGPGRPVASERPFGELPVPAQRGPERPASTWDDRRGGATERPFGDTPPPPSTTPRGATPDRPRSVASERPFGDGPPSSYAPPRSAPPDRPRSVSAERPFGDAPPPAYAPPRGTAPGAPRSTPPGAPRPPSDAPRSTPPDRPRSVATERPFGDAGPPPSYYPRSAPPASDRAAGTTSTPGRVVATGGPGFAGPDPTYMVAPARELTWLEVRWRDPASFARDARLQLCNHILVLARGTEALPEGGPLRIALVHRDLRVECPASVRAVGPSGATYRLLLDIPQVEQLRAFIAAHGTK